MIIIIMIIIIIKEIPTFHETADLLSVTEGSRPAGRGGARGVLEALGLEGF